MFLTSLLSHLSEPDKSSIDYDLLVPYVPYRKGIPKYIYQTNKNKETKEPITSNILKIKNLNPDWEYQLFDDSAIDAFIQEYYGNIILSYYKRIDSHYGAAKADFFRYLLLYQKGGVYLDIKSSINKPLSDFILEDDSFVLSFWDNLPGDDHEGVGHYSALPPEIERGEIIQWYIVASPGHPLLRKVIITLLQNIDHYNPYINGIGWTGTVTTTGPVMYTRTLYETLKCNSCDYPVRWTNIFKDAGFVYSIFEKNQKNNQAQTTPHTTVLSSDYRKATAPVIMHSSRILQKINCLYLSYLAHYHSKQTI